MLITDLKADELKLIEQFVSNPYDRLSLRLSAKQFLRIVETTNQDRFIQRLYRAWQKAHHVRFESDTEEYDSDRSYYDSNALELKISYDHHENLSDSENWLTSYTIASHLYFQYKSRQNNWVALLAAIETEDDGSEAYPIEIHCEPYADILPSFRTCLEYTTAWLIKQGIVDLQQVRISVGVWD